MKSIKLILIIVSIVTSKFSYSQKHQVEVHTDANGYNYETVTNDPVALRTYTLENGLKVFLSQNSKEPKIYYQLAVRAGSAYDPANNTGLAHYLEHLLFNGTDKLGALNYTKEKLLLDQIESLYELKRSEKDSIKKQLFDRKIDSVSYQASKYSIKGEYRKMLSDLGIVGVNAVTSTESTLYGCYLPSNTLEKFLIIEIERFTNPAFRAFSTELEIVYEEYNSTQDNSFWQFYGPINKALFKNHPYSIKTIGEGEHLKNPSLKATKAYFDTYYVPNNMSLTLVGDIDFEKTIKLIDQNFGRLKSKPLPKHNDNKTEFINEPITKEVKSSSPEGVWIGYRLGGVGTEDEKCLLILNEMLNNNISGLINLELKEKQRLARAYSWSFFIKKDYSAHYLEGRPNEGQSLEDVKEQLVFMLEKIKKGEFEDWMLDAASKKIKGNYLKEITGTNLETKVNETFANFRTWKDQLDFIDSLGSITKKQLVAYANRVYQNNYVVVYKRQSNLNQEFSKVKKPEITPILLNDDFQSEFSKKIDTIKVTPMYPEYIDFNKYLTFRKLKSGIDLVQVNNTENNFFEMDLIFEIEKADEEVLKIALQYLPLLGTNRFNNLELRKELYKSDLKFEPRAFDNRIIIHIEGPNESFEKGINFINNSIDSLVPDQLALDKLIERIINKRESNKRDKNYIKRALFNYTLYGENSEFRNNLSNNEFKKLKAEELLKSIKNLKTLKHKIFYYGNDLLNTESLINKIYTLPAIKSIKKNNTTSYNIQPTKPIVYFVHFESAQAEIGIEIRSNKFKSEKYAINEIFNQFYNKVAFEEIRERQALAYTNYASYFSSVDTLGYNFVEMYAAVQSDKTIEALSSMMNITKRIETYNDIFKNVRLSMINQIESLRTTGKNIFWRYENLKKMGIDNDSYEDLYKLVTKVDFNDIKKFFDENIKGKSATIFIIGNRDVIDLKELENFGKVVELDFDDLINY